MTTATGGSAADMASVRATLATRASNELREELGRVAASLRSVEEKARSGGCASIYVSAGDRGPLEVDEVSERSASLHAASGGAVKVASWALSATTGSIAPATAAGGDVAFTLTGANADPTAVVHLRAVSPAGIAETEISFKPAPGRLRHLLLTVTAHEVTTPGPTTDWQGTVDLTLAGSATVGAETVDSYTLDHYQIASAKLVDVEPGCTSTVIFAGGRVDPSTTTGAGLDLYPAVPGGTRRYELVGGWFADGTQVLVGSGPLGCLDGTSTVPFPGSLSSGDPPNSVRAVADLPFTDHVDWSGGLFGVVVHHTFDITITPVP